MLERGIASILHRDTIAVIVGAKTFERGEACFLARRVLKVQVSAGEVRGSVKPQEVGRANYHCRIWLREEGVAYECTCPMGIKLMFCKHAVAISLAHLEQERADAEKGLTILREALTTITQPQLVDGLLQLARRDLDLADDLKRLALEALSRQ